METHPGIVLGHCSSDGRVGTREIQSATCEDPSLNIKCNDMIELLPYVLLTIIMSSGERGYLSHFSSSPELINVTSHSHHTDSQ